MCRIFLKVLTFLSASVYLVSGDCRFDVKGEPVIVKDFGFKQVIVPNSGFHSELGSGESLMVYCEIGITICGASIGSVASITCNSNGNAYYARPNAKTKHILNCALVCDLKSSIQLYESKRKLANCEPHTTLAIGIHVANVTSKILAGICYDWHNLELKFVNYLAYRSRTTIITEATTENDFEVDVVTMDKPLISYEKYFNFLREDYFNHFYGSLQHNNKLLSNFRFDLASLIQDLPMTKDLQSNSNILNIIWWSNLRLGNWRTFLNLLEERSLKVKYNIITGTSGVVYIPHSDNSDQINETLIIGSENNMRRTAPAYIWTHLKALPENVKDDFVVIGYNSPFSSNEASILLCKDICADIDWFRKVWKLRLMPTMGLVFCCRPAEVAQKLDNFNWVAGDLTKGTDDNTILSATTTTPFSEKNSIEILF